MFNKDTRHHVKVVKKKKKKLVFREAISGSYLKIPISKTKTFSSRSLFFSPELLSLIPVQAWIYSTFSLNFHNNQSIIWVV